MDLNQIRYFVSVSQTLNFSESARRNGLTQPSISHHINELEKQLGAKLFLRDKRSVALTDAGFAFLPHAIEILETADKARLQIAAMEEGKGGNIRIAVLTTCYGVVSKCLSAFAQQHPEITVDIDFTSGREQTILMNEEKYDVHFCVDEMVPSGETFTELLTNSEQLCLAVHKDNPIASLPLDFSLLKDERFIAASSNDGPFLAEQIIKICESHNYEPKVYYQYDRAEAVLLAVDAGLGVGIVPGGLSKVFYSENVKLIPIPGEESRRSYVMAWRKNITNKSVSLFINTAKGVFREN